MRRQSAITCFIPQIGPQAQGGRLIPGNRSPDYEVLSTVVRSSDSASEVTSARATKHTGWLEAIHMLAVKVTHRRIPEGMGNLGWVVPSFPVAPHITSLILLFCSIHCNRNYAINWEICYLILSCPLDYSFR